MFVAVLLVLLALFQASDAAFVSLSRYSYTGVVNRGNDVLVFNSTAGVELRVLYRADTSVQYCETERNETSDNATLTFYAQQFGTKLYETSLFGATQIVSGNKSLAETTVAYLISCDAGKVNFLGDVPYQIVPGLQSIFLQPTVYDCVNRTAFTRRTLATELNCSFPTQSPTTGFTPRPTTAVSPGGFSSAHKPSIEWAVVVILVFALFMQTH